MKALKYGLTLVLGLAMLSGTGVFAQVAEPAAQASEASQAGSAWLPKHEAPHLPDMIDKLLTAQDYARATSEFEKFLKASKFNECDIINVSYIFYSRLLEADTTKTAFYQEKVDAYANSFLQSCGNTFEGYMLRESRQNPRIPDSTVAWMTAAMKLEPEAPILYGMRGEALLELGQTEAACKDLKKAMELDANTYADYYDTHCVKSEDTAGSAEGAETQAEVPAEAPVAE